MPLGQVAIASFANPQGLSPLGGNAWAETATSGQPLVGAPGSGALGVVQSGATESSNIDLTKLAKAVRATEPDNEWYFHHSKRMLLHGDLVAPTPARSKFTPKSMTALIKKLYA